MQRLLASGLRQQVLIGGETRMLLSNKLQVAPPPENQSLGCFQVTIQRVRICIITTTVEEVKECKKASGLKLLFNPYYWDFAGLLNGVPAEKDDQERNAAN